MSLLTLTSYSPLLFPHAYSVHPTEYTVLTPRLHSDTLNSRILRMDRLVALVDGTFASTHSDAIDALRAFFLFAACTVRITRAPP